MNPELKAKWVEALRSGKYEQCRRALHDGVGFCCLGVYGDVRGIPRASLLHHKGAVGPYDDTAAALNPLDEIPTVLVRHTLADLNDAGKSFAEIADWIERNL
jgi:hypothetical protein